MPSGQYPPNGGHRPPNQGWQYNYNNNGNSPKRPNDSGDWITIAVFFLIGLGIPVFFIPAIVLLIRKLRALSAQDQQRYRADFQQAADHVRRDVHHAADQVSYEVRQAAEQARKNRSSAAANTAPQPSKAPKKKRKRVGRARIITGACIAGVFLLTLPPTFIQMVTSWSGSDLSGFITCLVFFIGGLSTMFSGIHAWRQQERFFNYFGYIGANREVDLAHMAAAFGIPVKKLCKDLRQMLSSGILPSGYLDLAAGKLFLTEMGAKAPEPQVKAEEKAGSHQQEDDDILREIRMVNDQIPDQVMTEKIARIEEITGKILAYQKSHPDRSTQLRSFLNYYLPTTLKILRAYAQLDAQGIEGENISAAKARIEGMMDQVVSGFEKQLDKLFQDDAMDINSDVQVLENMLKKDGLSDDDQGMPMAF